MSYKEIQVPSITIIEIYSKALAEIEKHKEECERVSAERGDALFNFKDEPNWYEYPYWYNSYLSDPYWCNPVPGLISEIKSCLDAAKIAESVIMTKNQVIAMQKYENLGVLEDIESYLSCPKPYPIKIYTDTEPCKEEEEVDHGAIAEVKTLKEPKEPSAYAIVLPWIAILCGILFGLTHCS